MRCLGESIGYELLVPISHKNLDFQPFLDEINLFRQSALKEREPMNLFGRSTSGRRLPPSDTEIRLRCIEASARLATTETGATDKNSPKIAAQALLIAQAYYAFVKGRHLNPAFLQNIAVQEGLAPSASAIGSKGSENTGLTATK